MEISVKMSAAEFQEFMEWRKEKEWYEKDLDRLQGVPCSLDRSLKFAVEPVEGKPGRFKIVDQEHMGDLWDAAKEFMEE